MENLCVCGVYFFSKLIGENVAIDILLHNIKTAMGQADLIGDTLMIPSKKCINGYRYTFSNLDSQQGRCQQMGEVFKRSLTFLVATLAVVPSTGLASVGAVSKLIDVYRKFDEKVSSSSEIREYMPVILKPFSRTGDRTVAYLRARVVADETGIPLCYSPFKGSEIFAFHQLERNTASKYYRDIVYLNTPEQIQGLRDADRTQSILYLVPFAPFNRDLQRETADCSFPKYQPNWTQHQDRVKQLLQVESEKFNLPDAAYTIALHIRDGGDYDDSNTKTLHPLKLPSLNFYIGELIRVIKMKKQEGQRNFFVHIFTDAIHPENIRDQIDSQVRVGGAEIIFSYTPRDQATLQYDAGNMHQFKCMIRADSNLSGPIIAGSNTEIDIFPSGFDTRKKEVVISEVTQEKRGINRTRLSTGYSKPMEGWLPRFVNEFFYRYFGVHQVPLSKVIDRA